MFFHLIHKQTKFDFPYSFQTDFFNDDFKVFELIYL